MEAVALGAGALRAPPSLRRTTGGSTAMRARSRIASAHALPPSWTPASSVAACEVASIAEAAAPEAQGALEAAAEPVFMGFTQAELLIAAAPAILYGGWTLYRTLAPRATWVDYLQIIVTFVILYNIYSILVLKVRLF